MISPACNIDITLPSSLTCAANTCLIAGMLRASRLGGGSVGASPSLANAGMMRIDHSSLSLRSTSNVSIIGNP